MYKQIGTIKSITMDNNALARPVASLQDEYGSQAHIIIDDHCYVLVHNAAWSDGKFRWVDHIFPEAFEVLAELPPPV